MATVILGTGIIGASTAFYLSDSASKTAPSSIHLVEASPKLFDSASGYAAGFLARDWFSPPSAALGALSFDLHKKEAQEHGGYEKWGYSSSTATSLVRRSGERGDAWCRDDRSRAEAAAIAEDTPASDGPRWLNSGGEGEVEVISAEGTTAQVDPYRLSHFLLQTCRSRGVKLHQPYKATKLTPPSNPDSPPILHLESSDPDAPEVLIPTSRILLASGAWTPRVFKTIFPSSKLRLPITSLAGHSLLLQSSRWKAGEELERVDADDEGKDVKGVHAVFTTTEDHGGWSPEIFSRPRGEIYIAGLNDAQLTLPEEVTKRELDPKAIAAVRRVARDLMGRRRTESVERNGHGGVDDDDGRRNGNTKRSGFESDEDDDDLEVLREGLCFRPVTSRGTPILSKIGDEKLGFGSSLGDRWGGCWIAAGHGPWGISLSLGTGYVMAGMMEGKEEMGRIVKGLAL
ncbi:hypothetical protein MMC25_002445 [Agyrium rufum]|nr:hypothetical protein [Agyrium rufum]